MPNANVNAYLQFAGNTEEVFTYYQSIFGGEPQFTRFGDMEGADQMPEEAKSGIANVQLPIGDGLLMGSDVPEAMGKVNVGNNIQVCVEAGSAEDAKKFFAGLSEGGKVAMPIDKVQWAELFGMCTDKFGINWMVNYTGNPQG